MSAKEISGLHCHSKGFVLLLCTGSTSITNHEIAGDLRNQNKQRVLSRKEEIVEEFKGGGCHEGSVSPRLF